MIEKEKHFQSRRNMSMGDGVYRHKNCTQAGTGSDRPHRPQAVQPFKRNRP